MIRKLWRSLVAGAFRYAQECAGHQITVGGPQDERTLALIDERMRQERANEWRRA